MLVFAAARSPLVKPLYAALALRSLALSTRWHPRRFNYSLPCCLAMTLRAEQRWAKDAQE